MKRHSTDTIFENNSNKESQQKANKYIHYSQPSQTKTVSDQALENQHVYM